MGMLLEPEVQPLLCAESYNDVNHRVIGGLYFVCKRLLGRTTVRP